MKNLLFVGMIFIGVALIISSMILSRPRIVQEHDVNSEVNGNLGINQLISSSDTSNISDILRSYEAAVILGYSTEGELTLEISKGNVEGIPYVVLDNNYLFSKKALEEWIYSKSLNQ